jgi:hypothetical protein
MFVPHHFVLQGHSVQQCIVVESAQHKHQVWRSKHSMQIHGSSVETRTWSLQTAISAAVGATTTAAAVGVQHVVLMWCIALGMDVTQFNHT